MNFPNGNVQFILEIEDSSNLAGTIENLFIENENDNYELSYSEYEYLENQDIIIEEIASLFSKIHLLLM